MLKETAASSFFSLHSLMLVPALSARNAGSMFAVLSKNAVGFRYPAPEELDVFGVLGRELRELFGATHDLLERGIVELVHVAVPVFLPKLD
jgi:hypothetical protein